MVKDLMREGLIHNVTDTAVWVATFRALETARTDAIFHDRFAARLAGEQGRELAKGMRASPYVWWSVVVRTFVIDHFIQAGIADGVDTVINLGAGLDARPYRMDLPASLRWVEVDFPSMIARKEETLKLEVPKCHLERVKLDLSNGTERRQLLSRVNSIAKKVFVITEGVIPYLTEAQVSSLAYDLRAQGHFKYWVVDYFSQDTVKQMLRTPSYKKQMKQAPFRFHPPDWEGFFKVHGWKLKELKFMVEEGRRLNRPFPMPAWLKLLHVVFGKQIDDKLRESVGYAVLTPDS